MDNTIRVLGISGSLRKNSVNSGLLRAAQKVTPPEMVLSVFDLGSIPMYNEDVLAQEIPETVREFKSKIAASDALLIATPEYNYSVPGVLKNAIDWASRPPKDSPLNGKPLAIMGAGGVMGTVRAQMSLRQIAVFTNMYPLNKPEVLVSRAHEKFDTEGNLKDEPTLQSIRSLLEALVRWTLQLQGRAVRA